MSVPKPLIIGLAGAAGSGKSTAAAWLVAERGFRQESFAGALKDAVSAIFGWDRALLEGATAESRAWREKVDRWWAARLNTPHFTPRLALQLVGTEALRDGFHADVWVASLQRRLHGSMHDIVVSDVRFQNEADALRDAGGVVVRLERPGARAGAPPHSTETGAVTAEHTLVNDGTPEEMCERLSQLFAVIRAGPRA